ncbi:hypothetical protein Tco_1230817, partial [Tanacetum coccineum]
MGSMLLWIGKGGSIFFGVLERAKFLLAQKGPDPRMVTGQASEYIATAYVELRNTGGSTRVGVNSLLFGSDHGVESSESSNATAANGYEPLMLIGQNLLDHDSDLMASTMTKYDDNSVSDGAIQPEVEVVR